MMKKIFFSVSFFVMLFCATDITAQTKYTTHTIVQGETLSGLAVKYKTTVGDIMRLNAMDSKSILKIGEKIKIPSTGKPVPPPAASIPKPAAKTVVTNPPVPKPVVPKPIPASVSAGDSVTVRHVVSKGESLYSLSKKYNVSVTNLLSWNKLTADNIKIGQVLIVGHAAGQKATVVKDTASSEMPKQETVKKDSVLIDIVPVPSVNDTEKTAPVMEMPASPDSSGYFASLYGKDVEGRSLKTETGSSMVFKTTAGFTDKKYYILMNGVPPGSVVKISFADKTIYAKVLWKLDDMKDNEGLKFRISDAAAATLGISDTKFDLTVMYYE